MGMGVEMRGQKIGKMQGEDVYSFKESFEYQNMEKEQDILNSGFDKSKVLVLGKGFLGKQFEKNGHTVWGRDKFEWCDREYDEFDQIDWVYDNVLSGFDIIINTIGSSNTRWCEEVKNWDSVFYNNSELPRILSKACSNWGNKKLVHISSGCVYDQNNEPQTEDGFLASHCRYVVSKLSGEFNCNPERDLILRPRLFFGESEDKNNLLCKLSRFDKFLTEMNSYTSVQTIVEATEALLKGNASGIFNVAQEGYANLHEIAKWIGKENPSKMSGSQLRDQEGLYLVNNVLDISKLKEFYQPRTIQEEIMSCWQELNK